ncbi:hypothetical protein E4T56_gene13089 [Termitomyces sp. T112]|nr:hypothetical protein C0989_006091 [Termitomyces sp. Mn162]KAG5721559.1 hypothetical protein E4T56_gene13089 [Termitomyces sp. T112]KAH0580540.1 hypothetical protein H2248_002032 [Termitomyces sp. 'cryptogamus']KNZ78921.1 hypothetical protein J132_08146 [Termitomyces sp. J132]
MQNPKHDIEDVLYKLVTTKDPDEQKKAMTRYFSENAAFQSPVYKIAPHQQSREDALGVYQWLRIISPATRFDTTNIMYDEGSQTLIVEGNIIFPIRFLPMRPTPAKVLIHMKLKEHNKAYRITSQEVFYHPDQLTNHFFPMISPFIGFGLSTLAYASAIGAKLAQVMGIWRVSDSGKGNSGGNTDSQGHSTSTRVRGNRSNSNESHSSEETRIGPNEGHSGSEKQGGSEGAWHSVKSNGKQRKRRDASGYHHS